MLLARRLAARFYGATRSAVRSSTPMPVAGGTMTRLPTSISGYLRRAGLEPRQSRTKSPSPCASGKGLPDRRVRPGRRTRPAVAKSAFDGVEPSWLADGRHLVYTPAPASDKPHLHSRYGNRQEHDGDARRAGPVMQASVTIRKGVLRIRAADCRIKG